MLCLAFQDKPDDQKAMEMLQETKACQDRLEKDMYKLKARIDKAGDPKLLEKLKDHLCSVCANRNNIDHCLNWQELPALKMEDGEVVKKPSWSSANLDRYMVVLATLTEENEEGMEALKAVLKARGL